MESLTSGTIVSPGSFRCQRCGYLLRLASPEELGECPRCECRDFARASLFSTERIPAGSPDWQTGQTPAGSHAIDRQSEAIDRQSELAKLREQIQAPGQYLCYEIDGEQRIVALVREWTRIGRSLAADVRFDDPTVSRRHALIVRQPDGVRVLDDRSLNGVFVNDARIDGKVLSDGDEILVGRHRLSFLDLAAPHDRQNTGSGSLPATG